VLRGELPGPYIDENAQGYARAALIPGELTRGQTLGPKTPFTDPRKSIR
jgi:hypothetical protein